MSQAFEVAVAFRAVVVQEQDRACRFRRGDSFSARICRRYRSGCDASSLIPERESMTTLAGLSRSISASSMYIASLSSTSDGWYIVYSSC